MKKIIFIMILLPIFSFSQKDNFGVSAGYTTNGVGAIINYNLSISEIDAIHFGGYVSFANDEFKTSDIPYNDISLNIGYLRNILSSADERFKTSLSGGFLLGYEIINGGNTTLDTGAIIEAENAFLYGGFIGTEADFLLSDTISFAVTINQFFHPESKIGNAAFYAGLGIKYHIIKKNKD